MTRPMTEHLAKVIDGFSGSERRAVLRIAARSDDSTPMARILRAVATELKVRQLDEDELLLDLERDRLADMDALDAQHPYPPRDPTMRFTKDPVTGELVRDEGDG